MSGNTTEPGSTERLRRHLHLVCNMAAYSDLSHADKRCVLRRVVLDLYAQERKLQAAKTVDFRGVD